MSENDLFALFWKCVAAVLCVLIVTIGGCQAYEVEKVTEMVKAGADPIAAYCATGFNTHQAAICLAATQRIK